MFHVPEPFHDYFHFPGFPVSVGNLVQAVGQDLPRHADDVPAALAALPVLSRLVGHAVGTRAARLVARVHLMGRHEGNMNTATSQQYVRLIFMFYNMYIYPL